MVRTIYLYIFALLGLVLLTIGGVRFVDMGLRTFVFTKADEEQRLMYKEPPYMPYPARVAEPKNGNLPSEKEAILSEEEKASIEQWRKDYADWKENRSRVDYVSVKRHRDASLNLALILIGLPLYLYHWRVIKREAKDKNNSRV